MSVQSRVSAAGLAVLQACLDRTAVSIKDLVRRSSCRQPVARASLSRTLRRLWRAGLVELSTQYGTSLTEYCAAIEVALAAQERDLDAAFAMQLDVVRRGAPGFFPFTTAADWLHNERTKSARRKRGKPMHVVCLTSQGRELLARLTSRQREVNQPEQQNALVERLTSNGLPANRSEPSERFTVPEQPGRTQPPIVDADPLPRTTCAFAECDAATNCALEGGCVRRRFRKGKGRGSLRRPDNGGVATPHGRR